MPPPAQTPQAWPSLALIAQSFTPSPIPDAAAAVEQELARLDLAARIAPGQTVAVTAGSRGIKDIAPMLRRVCDLLKDRGARPFLFPSMGSHGGATAEGQAAMLASLGLDEEQVGVPVRSCMDTVVLGQTPEGLPVHCDSLAAAADHVVVVNRVKPHTKFKGGLESGLFKMLVVGMGKHQGATLLHAMAPRRGMETLIRSAGRLALDKLPVLLGLGIVENGLGQVHAVQALLPKDMEAGEERLLALAKDLAPRLPFDELDLLVLDRIGKDISGTGMDPNVTGRNRDLLGDFCITPRIKRILVLDLSPGSRGNALGIGFADFTTDRLVAAMDTAKTVTNALTAMSPEKAAIPVHFPTDRQALSAALNSLGLWEPHTLKMARILDTAHLARLLVTPALLADPPARVRLLGGPAPLAFGPDGNLPEFAAAMQLIATATREEHP